VVMVVEISGPSSSSTAVPSSVFVFHFGLPRSRSDADGGVDVEMAMEEMEVGEGAAHSRRDGDICRAAEVKGRVNEPSRNRDNDDWPKKVGHGDASLCLSEHLVKYEHNDV